MKNILNKAGKTLATIVLASAIGLSGCNKITEIETKVNDYSCKERKFPVDNKSLFVSQGNKKVIKEYDIILYGLDDNHYTRITYTKNMTFEEATNAIDVCETAFKKKYNK